mgnify:CR=1 FL=1
MKSFSESYKAAGVDVTAGYEAVNRIKPLVESTYIPGVIGTLGGFGGRFRNRRFWRTVSAGAHWHEGAGTGFRH